ncbi:mitochondrial protein [Tremella mesenterica]|uniref:Mitochondrial protein n=1 Tax=Tremella mesenterica TaxID=5217 RepID=A0A4Q1BIN9_TREME|nr:mitochondrial protein [Tremella mesenterica]
MDPNAEDRPPQVELVEVDVEVSPEVPSSPRVNEKERVYPSQPVLDIPSSSSIFRAALPHDEPPDPERTQQQQEEEFQRKLRGEYEAAQRRVSDVVTGNMHRPLRLSSIRLSPQPSSTRTSYLNSLLSPFISPSHHPWMPKWLYPAPPPPGTLHEVLLTTRALMHHLDKIGIFDVGQSGVRLEPKRGGEEDEVELVLALKERSRLFFKAGTEVGGGEGGGTVTARIRNAFGGAESLEANASIGTKTKSSYQVMFHSPILASPLLSFALSAFSLDRDNTAFASHREAAQGGRANLSAIAPWGRHDLTYEYIQRDITHLSPTASVSIRELAHPSTKSSLIHTWTSDTRDDPWTGTSGRLLKFSHEYSGLPGSSQFAHFFKSTTQSQLSRALHTGSNIHYSVSSLTTLLLPLYSRTSSADGHPPVTYLPDRTYLGGPNSVRGWKVGGLGRRDGPDSLGGDLAWGLGLSVFAPIPKKELWPLKLHSFLNIGKVVGYDTNRSFSENMGRLYRSPNLSVGLGLMYRLDPIRIELNFTLPLVGRKNERLSRGLGVGVGVEFL